MRRAIFIAAVTFFQISSFAQHGWQLKTMPGFLIPHHESMQSMFSHVYGIEAGREWKLDSISGYLSKRHHNPFAGLSTSFWHLGKNINGKAACVQGYYDMGIPIYSNVQFRFRASLGVGFLSKQYNEFTNPQNRAIGSNVNGFMQLLSYVQLPVSQKLQLQLGIGMSHYSNGNWSQPNLGINLPSFVFGFKYFDAENKYIPVMRKQESWQMLEWQFSARVGKRQMSIDEPRNIAMFIAEAVVHYPHNQIRSWRAGLTAFYDRSYQYVKFSPQPKPTLPKTLEVAIQAGHEFKIGRIGLVTDLGVYLYRPDKTKRMYYEGVGLKYYVNDNWVIVNRLKAHLTSADYFEWGVVYRIKGKKDQKPGFVNGFRWALGGW